MSKNQMNSEQFNVLVRLCRGNEEAPSTITAKMVLVERVSNDAVKASTGVSKENLYDAVQRWKEKDDLIRQAYGPDGSKLQQFDLLVKLCRGDSEAPSTLAAKMVLVDNIQNQMVKNAIGISKQSLYDAVRRWKEKDDWVKKAYSENDS
ncbi:hypothetical protein I6M49_21995 [Shewanella algae]|uniref:hypothetical protein n=1 Tax=Shewanella algae TaxID=38313 RepID=UPI001AACCC59|nr:hypothetical protein [Shewanella algae]MBO2656118.1 hypothetical protein [Shewanella algae]